MPASRRSPRRVIVASGWSVSSPRRVRTLRAGFVIPAEWPAGRRIGVGVIPRRPAAGITGRISRRRPGSIRLRSHTESGLKPREVRLSGLVWRHALRMSKSSGTTATMMRAVTMNNSWLNRSQAVDRPAVTPSRSMPSPEYRSLAALIIRARVARRLAAGQSRVSRRPPPLRAGRSQARFGAQGVLAERDCQGSTGLDCWPLHPCPAPADASASTASGHVCPVEDEAAERL
jgi:hypothetical protein